MNGHIINNGYYCCLDLTNGYLTGSEIIYPQVLYYNYTHTFKGQIIGLVLKTQVLFTVVNYSLQTMSVSVKYRTNTPQFPNDQASAVIVIPVHADWKILSNMSVH